MTERPDAAPAPTEGGLDEILALKKAKVAELKSRGVDAYPARPPKRSHTCAQAAALCAGLETGTHGTQSLDCAGRLVRYRDQGKTIFADLRDFSGRIQLYIKKDAVGEQIFNLVKKDVHAGDFLAVSGAVMKTKTGEPTIAVSSVILLSKSLRPLPDKFHGLKDVDFRYRNRHLDLIASPETLEKFAQRSKIITAMRSVMERRCYVEVETPILLSQAGGASARPFSTHHNALDQDMVLRIATELYLKRLIVGGFDKVYEIGRIFRNEGIDTRHNPEFTMMESYEAYSDYNGMAELFEELVGSAAEAIGVSEVDYGGKKISVKPPFKREYLPELWKKYCGAPIEDILQGKGFDRKGLLALASKIGAPAGEKTPSAKVFERIFDARILEHCEQMTFVFDHPTAITPLAKLKAGSQGIVERFEAFCAGQEYANAYSELNDPEDQRDRLVEQARQRKEEGDQEADVLDSDFVEAMEAGMPPMGGMGVGIDRLVMLLTGQTSIRDVILFPTLKREELP
ncbi:MAG: lysine--tRNA ligase [Elusimicrobia bacterium]|nr:lysine--tRNA ligase [Elusimicrobiota bacterium]